MTNTPCAQFASIQDAADGESQPGSNVHTSRSNGVVKVVDDITNVKPTALGSGKRLFAEGTIPAAFKVTESQVSPSGIILVNYERAGAVTTNSV